jgi:hypothetical protein
MEEFGKDGNVGVKTLEPVTSPFAGAAGEKIDTKREGTPITIPTRRTVCSLRQSGLIDYANLKPSHLQLLACLSRFQTKPLHNFHLRSLEQNRRNQQG